MHDDIADRNRVAIDLLRRVAQSLTLDELIRPIDPPWTTAALLAHIAFWDRFTHARWLHARQTLSASPIPIDDTAMELVNQAALPEWTATPPASAIDLSLAAAETIDEFIQSLDQATISRVVGKDRLRLVDRSIHRREHLATIQDAFQGRFSTEETAE